MKKNVTITVDEAIADAVTLIQVLKECGVVAVSDEVAGMRPLWELLSDADKSFYTGMMKGALTAMGTRGGEISGT